MIIAFPAGSGVDVIGRALAQAITQQTGQNVIVLNRDGAAGTLGFATLATAAPDGHTIAFGPTTPIANAPYLVKGVRYNVKSFSYICQVFENVFAIAVGPQSKITSAQELLAAAKANPGKLTYGHAGLGTIPHLSMENTAEALNQKFAAVPFRGDAPLVPALLRGEVDFAAVGVSTIRPQPSIRPLAIFSDKRHAAYPDVPTMKELGVPTSVPPGHNGLFAPAGLPAAVRNALEGACRTILKQDTDRQGDDEHRPVDRISQRRGFPRADGDRLQIEGRADQAAGTGRAVGRCFVSAEAALVIARGRDDVGWHAAYPFLRVETHSGNPINQVKLIAPWAGSEAICAGLAGVDRFIRNPTPHTQSRLWTFEPYCGHFSLMRHGQMRSLTTA